MNDSILTSIKKLLGIEETYEHFDADILIHINTVLAILTQIGVGPSDGFTISDKSATWFDFLGKNVNQLVGVRSYIYMKVRLIFDPPTSSAAVESMTHMVEELEWRLHVTGDKTI